METRRPPMKLMLRTAQFGSPRRRGEGLRIGTARRTPRGVPKKDWARRDFFDVWFPTVAPSARLLDGTRVNFTDRYLRERRASTEARQGVLVLAQLAKRTPITIGCYCEDESQCHRRTLKGVIELAAVGKWPPPSKR